MTGGHDLIVIGGGPAGMAAATQARALGLNVALIDEQRTPGGQIYRAVTESPLAHPAILGPEYGRGQVLADEFRRSGADHVTVAAVTDVTPDLWVGFERLGEVSFLKARHLVIATGALERPFPVPGWTLPGVMTAGAAQTLLKSAALSPGERSVLAGTGPLLYLLAWQLLQAGQPVQALLDTTPAANYLRALAQLPNALRKPSYLVKGLRLLNAIRRSGIRHVRGVTALRVEGDCHASRVVFRAAGAEETLTTDLVLLHQGVVPNIQIARALRCEITWDATQLCWKPVTDAWGMTSRRDVSVAGDGSGIGGAAAAEHAGRLAAVGAAARLGVIDEGQRDGIGAPVRDALRAELAPRPFLDTLYRPGDDFRVPDDDGVIVCRCEEVTLGNLRDAVTLGCSGPNQAKAFVRAGMGPCQGRMCGLTVCESIARLRRATPHEVGYYRLRAPFKPVRLGSLAEMTLPQRETGCPAGHTPAGGTDNGLQS